MRIIKQTDKKIKSEINYDKILLLFHVIVSF